ncbi:MAG TPA: molybdopterin cofactor-binding domain-containing protein [Caulobacteraceae bacterium]|nr:molybdopterin cofactor-binding domain-containing protein [Caulobacteraceae bacterium]
MKLDRRQFVTWSAGGALLLGLGARGASAQDQALSPWIRIAPNGDVTLYSTVSEMGQGARTGQAQVLADELDVPWERVTVELGPPSPTGPFSFLATGGSSSIRAHWKQLREAGATARAQLIAAAAKRWNCAEGDCRADLGLVKRVGSGQELPYGALAADAAACTPPATPPLKPAAERRYIGKPLPTLENADKSRGKAVYGIDVRMPGLLRASIRQAPVYGAKLASVDEAPALAVPGVRKVVKLDNAVAVVAASTWSAFKGVRALQPQWTTPSLASSSADIGAKLLAALEAKDAEVAPAADHAPLRAEFKGAPRKVEATYATAYLAHATLEPMNTTVCVGPDKIEVWSPTQMPTATRLAVANTLGRKPDEVILHNTLLGGGFGRRLIPDFAVQAAKIAAQADGAPVQLVWTREEDTAHDYYRRATLQRFRAGLGADGLITGYEAISAGADSALRGGGPAPYGFTRFAGAQATATVGVPQGPWRSVDEGLYAFGRESVIDECAHAAGIDPLEYRRKLIGDNARVRRLVDSVAEQIDWGKPKGAGVGRGLALVEAFGSLVATGVEVRVEGQTLKVTRIAVAGDVGTAVNPQQVKAQFEGGATMGLSAALGEAMSFTGGKADQQNFNAYKLIRMRQTPVVTVELFDSPDADVGGAGEPGVPGVAPALANAVFDATGKRIRTLPFAAQGFTV